MSILVCLVFWGYFILLRINYEQQNVLFTILMLEVLKMHFTCFRENGKLVAICNSHRIVDTFLMTENSVRQRKQYIEFCLRPGFDVISHSKDYYYFILQK